METGHMLQLNDSDLDQIEDLFPRPMLKSLLDKGYCLSGSLLLQILTNATWKANDIDFFYQIGPYMNREDVFAKLCKDFDVEPKNIFTKGTYADRFGSRMNASLRIVVDSYYISLEKKANGETCPQVNVIAIFDWPYSIFSFICRVFDFPQLANVLTNNGLCCSLKRDEIASKVIYINPRILDLLLESLKDKKCSYQGQSTIEGMDDSWSFETILNLVQFIWLSTHLDPEDECPFDKLVDSLPKVEPWKSFAGRIMKYKLRGYSFADSFVYRGPNKSKGTGPNINYLLEGVIDREEEINHSQMDSNLSKEHRLQEGAPREEEHGESEEN